jgi:hypothetical protein
MTLGASTMAAAAATAIALLALVRNRRRSVFTLSSLPCDEPMVGAFGHVIPGADQKLELRHRSRRVRDEPAPVNHAALLTVLLAFTA